MDNFPYQKLNDFGEREKQYKEKIEQLEHDLDNERNIYEIDNKNSEIILNIKKEISTKEKEIQEIIEKNNKQKEQLESISHEIDIKLKKLSDTTQIVKIKKKEDIVFDDDIKVKEKQISNINNLIDILQIENDKLKMKLDFISYNNGNNGEKFKIIELDKKILALNQDIKQKKLIIQEHNKCLSIKNQILKKISLIQKEILGEKEKNNKLKKKLSSTESKYILIKQDYENKIKNQYQPISKNNNSKIYLKQNKGNYNCSSASQNENVFSQHELNAILNAVGGNKNIYLSILKKLNINENNIEKNNTKNLENQIDILLKKQKMNINKNNQLIEEINNIEKNNKNKNNEINSLKKELEELKEEYNKKRTNNSKDINITEDNNKYNKNNKENINNNDIKDNNDIKNNKNKINDKKVNANFVRIKIDANKKKEDNS